MTDQFVRLRERLPDGANQVRLVRSAGLISANPFDDGNAGIAFSRGFRLPRAAKITVASATSLAIVSNLFGRVQDF